MLSKRAVPTEHKRAPEVLTANTTHIHQHTHTHPQSSVRRQCRHAAQCGCRALCICVEQAGLLGVWAHPARAGAPKLHIISTGSPTQVSQQTNGQSSCSGEAPLPVESCPNACRLDCGQLGTQLQHQLLYVLTASAHRNIPCDPTARVRK